MKKRLGAAVAALGIGLATMASMPSASAAERGAETGGRPPATLVVPGDAYHPESVTTAANGDVYVASITTGAVVRFRAGVWAAETFIPVGVNIGTAGVLVDDTRKVLWTCDIDLSFQQPTKLKAFSLAGGKLVASYTVPDRGVCADIVLARGAVFITDTVDPTVQPALPGRILRLTTPSLTSAVGGTLSVWSADEAFTYPTGGLQINGIAYDGRSAIYVTNYSAGTLNRVGIAADGSALEATKVPIPRPLQNPDGIRMLDTYRLLVTENPGPLSVIDVRSGAITQVGTFDQPTSVARSGNWLWVAEGQVLRLQQGQPPNLPFKIVRVPVPIADL